MPRDFDVAIDQLTKNASGYLEPKDRDYGAESRRRHEAQIAAFYYEHGPFYDHHGDYLCGECIRKKGSSGCTWVEGKISMEAGSCMFWKREEAERGTDTVPSKKYSKEMAGYAERPKALGFGCKRCEYADKAKHPDNDGRPLFCRIWAAGVAPTACCALEDGPDLVS